VNEFAVDHFFKSKQGKSERARPEAKVTLFTNCPGSRQQVWHETFELCTPNGGVVTAESKMVKIMSTGYATPLFTGMAWYFKKQKE
jgi:hypothetical protein